MKVNIKKLKNGQTIELTLPNGLKKKVETNSKEYKSLYPNVTTKIDEDTYYKNLPDVNITAKNWLSHPVRKSMNEAGKNMMTGIGTVALIGTGAAGLVSAPLAFIGGTAGGIAGDYLTNKVTDIISKGKYKNWGEFAGDKTGIPAEIMAFTNPGAIVGGVSQVLKKPIQRLNKPVQNLTNDLSIDDFFKKFDIPNTSNISKREEITKARKWMNNWTNHPEFDKRASKLGWVDRTTFEENKKGMIADLKNMIPGFNVKYDFKKELNNTFNTVYDKKLPTIKIKTISANPITGEEPLGRYYTNDFKIDISNNSPTASIKSTAIHELTHALNYGRMSPFENTFKNNLFKDKHDIMRSLPKSILERQYKYLTEPSETYARIMQLRELEKIKPGQIITKEQAKDFINRGSANKIGDIDPSWFNSFKSPEKLRRLMNTLPATIPAVVTGYGLTQSKKQGGKLNIMSK